MIKWLKGKCFVFHDWGRFEVISNYRFRRTCLKCGKTKVENY